jgi:hypothetical protein
MDYFDDSAIAASNPGVDLEQLRALRGVVAELKSLGIDTDQSTYSLRRPFEQSHVVGSAWLGAGESFLGNYGK